MIVGSSYSAEDICSQCIKFGAQDLICSYRQMPMDYAWPDNVTNVPLLERVDGSTCTFVDGSVHENIDVIIFCTGYQHAFPFLEPSLRLETKNRLYVNDLYEGVVWPAVPQLFYVGMQNQWFSFTMFQVQSYYIRDVILGRIVLPTQEEMEAQVVQWQTEENELPPIHAQHMEFQAKYVHHLMHQTDCPKFKVEDFVSSMVKWEEHKMDNIMTYRDHAHPSFISGAKNPMPQKPWMEEFDDSLQHFLSPYQKANAY